MSSVCIEDGEVVEGVSDEPAPRFEVPDDRFDGPFEFTDPFF